MTPLWLGPSLWAVGLLLATMVVFLPPDASGLSLRILAAGAALMGTGLALGLGEVGERMG